MSKLMEDRIKELTVQIAANLLMMGDLSHEKIAKATGLTLSDIKDIEQQLETAKAQQQ